jgi:polar amino acid transport system substrate-binding protein
MGLKAGRFQFSMGPIGDFPSRQANVDFIDYVREYVIFAVPKGNPHHIHSLSDACGLRISVMSGGSAEKVLRNQSKLCLEQGKPEVHILSYSDQPTSLLVVKAKRADAFFSSQAPLTYYVQQSKGELELAAVGQPNGFDELYQGAVVAKDSPLGQILLNAMQELFDNGTYALIMDKWGLESNRIDTPQINISTVKLP